MGHKPGRAGEKPAVQQYAACSVGNLRLLFVSRLDLQQLEAVERKLIEASKTSTARLHRSVLRGAVVRLKQDGQYCLRRVLDTYLDADSGDLLLHLHDVEGRALPIGAASTHNPLLKHEPTQATLEEAQELAMRLAWSGVTSFWTLDEAAEAAWRLKAALNWCKAGGLDFAELLGDLFDKAKVKEMVGVAERLDYSTVREAVARGAKLHSLQLQPPSQAADAQPLKQQQQLQQPSGHHRGPQSGQQCVTQCQVVGGQVEANKKQPVGMAKAAAVADEALEAGAAGIASRPSMQTEGGPGGRCLGKEAHAGKVSAAVPDRLQDCPSNCQEQPKQPKIEVRPGVPLFDDSSEEGEGGAQAGQQPSQSRHDDGKALGADGGHSQPHSSNSTRVVIKVPEAASPHSCSQHSKLGTSGHEDSRPPEAPSEPGQPRGAGAGKAQRQLGNHQPAGTVSPPTAGLAAPVVATLQEPRITVLARLAAEEGVQLGAEPARPIEVASMELSGTPLPAAPPSGRPGDVGTQPEACDAGGDTSALQPFVQTNHGQPSSRRNRLPCGTLPAEEDEVPQWCSMLDSPPCSPAQPSMDISPMRPEGGQQEMEASWSDATLCHVSKQARGDAQPGHGALPPLNLPSLPGHAATLPAPRQQPVSQLLPARPPTLPPPLQRLPTPPLPSGHLLHPPPMVSLVAPQPLPGPSPASHASLAGQEQQGQQLTRQLYVDPITDWELRAVQALERGWLFVEDLVEPLPSCLPMPGPATAVYRACLVRRPLLFKLLPNGGCDRVAGASVWIAYRRDVLGYLYRQDIPRAPLPDLLRSVALPPGLPPRLEEQLLWNAVSAFQEHLGDALRVAKRGPDAVVELRPFSVDAEVTLRSHVGV
ncbi:hypothetical protein N2152v2_003953 [Parachlorella kessleri]